MKRRSADGSVGSPHARVGHCQASNKAESPELTFRAFCYVQYVKKRSYAARFSPSSLFSASEPEKRPRRAFD
ncbi:hypothetical protein B7L62_14045 [Serratia marcescens]|nr:hypothetical protein B7L62_14045 [Serratia marcescens]